MNPITFDEWGAQEALLLWATENGGNASQVIQYLEQNQCTYEAAKESGSARWKRKMAVSRPMFMVGCKDQAPRDMYRQQLVGELAAQCIGGKSTVLYDTLYKRGLADRTFDPDYFTFAGGACALFSGESSEPDAVREALEQEIQRVAAEGLD